MKYILKLFVLAVTVAASAGALAWPRGSVPFPATFRGNPYVTITAINAGGGIAASQTSCEVPCFVQVSASAMTATGTSKPYEDLEFSWSFGNPSGTETFTNPGVGAGTKNANSDQVGPEAAYVYRSAGTYTVTLNIRGKNGGGYTTAQTTQSITVSSFNKSGAEYWADSNAGGTNAGTLANPFNTVAAINAAIGATSHVALHVAANSNFSGSTGLKVWSTAGSGPLTGLRIDKYNSGADPVFNVSSGTDDAFFMYNGGGASPIAVSNVVVSNIKFSKTGTATGGQVVFVNADSNQTTGFVNHVYFDNCTFQNTLDNANNTATFAGDAGLFQSGAMLWNVSVSSPLSPSTSTNFMGFYGGPKSWFAVVGGSFSGSGHDAQLDHHIYPEVQTHSLYKWVNFGSGPTKNFNINTNWNSLSGSVEIAQYHLISENIITGTGRAWDAGQSAPVPTNPLKTNFTNFVAEYNNITGLTADGSLVFDAVTSMTVRYNNVWNVTGGGWYRPAQSTYQLASYAGSLYNNNLYIPSGAATGNGAFVDMNGAFTQAQLIRGNITFDARTTTLAMGLLFSSFPSNGSVVLNQFWTPNNSGGNYLNNNNSAVSLATWNTQMGQTSTNANPNWTDPANGVF